MRKVDMELSLHYIKTFRGWSGLLWTHSVVVSFDDLVALAHVGPVGQVAAAAFVHHFRGGGHGRGPLLGLFETFVLALVDDVGLAAVQAAIDELAARFQNFFGRGHAFSGGGIALGEEFAQLAGQGSAFGLARFRRRLGHFDYATDARFEVFIAAQFEQAQELLDSFLLRRVGAGIDACLSLGGDRAHLRPGFSIREASWDGGAASDAVLDEGAHFGAAFRSHHLVWSHVAKLGICAQLGLDGFPACRQARVLRCFVGEGATKNSQ